MRPIVTKLALVLAGLTALAAPAASQDFDHSAFDTVLARFVQDGRVDYAALQVRRQALDEYLSQVGSVSEEQFAGWSQENQIAYLLNAYNAYALQTVIDNYPLQGSSFFKKLTSPKRFAYPSNSIRHIDGVFDGIKHKVAGREMTLDDIEHGTLRADYNEPRIHFALVCAAVSCPPIRAEAYRGDRLDEQLDDQGAAFLNDPRLNRFEVERGQVYLSKIFDWFGEDFRQFAGKAGYQGDERVNGVLSFCSRYLLDRVARFLESEDYEVQYIDYDWTLNDQAVAAATQ